MATNKELLAEVAALKAQLEELKKQPVVVQERVVYVESATVASTKISRREQLIALLLTAERVHKNKIMQETGMSAKNVDSYKCYLNGEGWNISLNNGCYALEDSINFRKMAQLESSPDWMKMKYELIIAREKVEAEVKARFNK